MLEEQECEYECKNQTDFLMNTKNKHYRFLFLGQID